MLAMPPFLTESFDSIMALVDATNLPQQIREVDGPGLIRNPWFLVPAVGLIGYLLYRKAIRDLIILLLIGGMWYSTGTEYMQTLVVGEHLQLSKVLPVVFGGAGALALIIYLLFGRSD